MISLASGSNTPYKVGAQCHPGMIDPADAAQITIPTLMLASGEESTEEVAAFQKALKVENHVEIFADQVHGWMSARADLEDEKVKMEYERGYKILLSFFAKHL